MTAVVVEAGLAAEEALAAGWLEKRWCVNVGHLVEIVEIYPSVGSSLFIVYSPKG